MKKIVYKKLAALGLASLLGSPLGCSPDKNEPVSEDIVNAPIAAVYDIVKIEIPKEDNIEDLIDFDEVENFDDEDIYTEEENVEIYVQAKENTTIYSENNTKSDKLGILFENLTLPYISAVNDEWYEVLYDGKIAYVKSKNISIIECIDIPGEENIPFIYTEDDLSDCLDAKNMIKANATVNVRQKPTTDSKKLDQLSRGNILPFIGDYNDEWCEVLYNGASAYVYKEYVDKITGYTPKDEMYDMVYTSSKTPLIDVKTGETLLNIPRHEAAEVYGRTDDSYLVSYNGTIGYVSKEYAYSLGDTYIIVDISDQHMKLYVDDKLMVEDDIVTGKPSTPTYCGLFDINKMDTDIYWPEFGVKVKMGMRFSGKKWFHDASWRTKFGPQVKPKDRSHGCINLREKIMRILYKYCKIGTAVLVKK